MTSRARRLGRGRKGFTLMEVGIAAFVIAVVSMAGAAYYISSRVKEIQEWQEQNALFLAEREVENWQSEGYTALSGFVAADTGPTNYLPYGYRFGTVGLGWIPAQRYKPVTLDGFDYRVRAQLLFTNSTGTPANDHFVLDVWNNGVGNINVYYRRVRVVMQWGGFSGTSADNELHQETRMAR
ncbi:MAG: type II secretion system protein [Planctomycetes bacterium]|nr:type II secretion system protein [Planctomycetota bacterium]